MLRYALPPSFVRRRACRASCSAAVRTCARHLPGGPLAVVRRILCFVLERRNTPFERRPVPQPFLHVHPWRSPTRFSAPPVAASTRTTLASRASCISSRQTCAHVGLPWLPFVSLRPSYLDVLCRHTSLGTLVYILRRRKYSTSSRLALAHSSGSSLPIFLVIPMPAILPIGLSSSCAA